MSKAAMVEKELITLETQFWQAIKDRDIATAVRLTDFPCIVAGPHGVGRVDEKAFSQMMKDPHYTIDEFELTDTKVRLLNNDVAVVAYKAHEELTVDGEPVQLDVADTSTWVRRNGRWLCAQHSEAILGDPYGRDRKADR